METLSWFEGLGSCQKWTMNTEMYRQIWIHHVIASRKHLIGNSFPFQHDKKRKRMDQCSKRSEKQKQKMQHYQSWIGPDLNIIETVWEHLNKGHSKMSFECLSRSLESFSWKLHKKRWQQSLPNNVLPDVVSLKFDLRMFSNCTNCGFAPDTIFHLCFTAFS